MALSETDVSKRKDASTIRQRRAKVTYSYEPQHEDELALKVGDELIISGEDEEGWYQATLNGKSGVCPSNFVDLLPDGPPPSASSAVEDLIGIMDKKATAAEATAEELKKKLSNSLSRGKELGDSLKRQSVFEQPGTPAASVSATAVVAPEKKMPEATDDTKSEITAKKVKGVGLGNIFAGGLPSKASLRPTDTNGDKEKLTGSATTEKKASATNEASAKKDTTGLEYAKADYDYVALNDDELSFKVGDIIRIIAKECEDEGWWRGELNGLSGVFPDNFCSVIPLSEVPVPRRPIRTPSADKASSLKKDDKNEKENHDRTSKFLPREKSSERLTADDKKDKVEKTTAKKDDPLAHNDIIPEKAVRKDDSTDKVEKSSPAAQKKIDSDTKAKLEKSVTKPAVSAVEKKPERPEKPVLKPIVGKKPVGGAGSRESTPSVHPEKPELKPVTPSATVDAKPKLDSAGSSSSKHTADESRPRGGSSGTTPSGVRLRHAESTESSKSVVAAISSTENGGGVAVVGFDSVNSSEKLIHPTASRAKGPTRRPPSQLFRPASDEGDGSSVFGTNGLDGEGKVNGGHEEIMAKDKDAAKADSRKSTLDREGVTRKDSFMKQLDSALSQPKSPTSTAHRAPDLTSSTSLEDEVKTLKAEIKSLKEDFGSQVKELRDALKTQADKIVSLERELEKMKKADK
ncbi:putative SH3 domain-containing kinase-binding protein 1 [Hypsibius exemplaris]|uniref:SH3 domain-containing kinase-binding protein 1 n=1 Tax=Hypsibius exemplaris TaxID=2072580 RepID=A0A1W0XFE0_HYPEX|nr:putative SH3 domain-containing kinase-binding protein 1 [Hypsibius exemplaris]